jgi:hypothetical protein
MIKKALYIVSFSALLSPTLLAQSNLNQEVIAVGERELQVKEVYKQAFFPTEEDTVVRKKESSYQIDPVLYKTKYVPDTIVPANLRILEPLSSLNRFYAKAGLGLYTTSMADVYYNSLRNRKTGLAIAFNHRASKGGIDELPNKGAFSDNKIALNGRVMGKKAQMDGGLEFQSIVRNVIQPIYNDANLSSRQRESKVSHEFIRANADVIKLQRKRKDLGLELNTALNYTRFYDDSELGFLIGAGGSKKMGNEIFGAKVSADYNKYGNEPTNASTIIKISPQVETNTEQFYVKAGLSIQGNLQDSKSNFSFFPNIEFRAILADNIFTPYASFTGNYLRNNLSEILTVNPYLYDTQSLKNSREKINLMIGARTKLGKNASFDFNYRFQNTDDHLFYAQALLSTGEDNGVYTLIYDNLKASTVSVELSAIASRKLEFITSFQYHSYTTKNISDAYYLPNIESKLVTKYTIQKKLIVNLGLSFIGERTAGESLVATGGDSEPLIGLRAPIDSKLKAYADLGLGFEYRYNRRLSAFVNFNNVLSAKYQQFNPYQAQRFGVLGGLSYTF